MARLRKVYRAALLSGAKRKDEEPMDRARAGGDDHSNFDKKRRARRRPVFCSAVCCFVVSFNAALGDVVDGGCNVTTSIIDDLS